MPAIRKTTNNAAGDVFTAVAHPVRRQILDRLALGEMTVSTLAEPFEITRPAISQHLSILLESGLVAIEKRGREHYYQLRPENLNEIYRWISHFERFWPEKLDVLGDYLDSLKAQEDEEV
jgi:DNA-binding transcriptional ArsR family regulator